MANPQIRSFSISPTTVAPGASTTGTVDAFDPDNRTVHLRAKIGTATAVTTLTVEDVPVPAPVFEEVDAAGVPVTVPTVDFVADPTNPFRVIITPRTV